ncbi:MAG: hypothetical protein IJD64_04780 [Clostridia bacterium]|nr:hypothetical protein [Clostridia bacterium]
MKTLIPRCPSCNNALEQSVQVCEYCDSPVVITSFSTLGGMSAPKVNKYANAYKDMISENPDSEILAISLGMCFMRLKLYDKAYEAFDKAISAYTENPEVYFMAAVCALGGKKAFLAGKANVDKAISMLKIAIDIEPRGIFYYFDAYLRFDFYKRKALNIRPAYTDSLMLANRLGYSHADVQTLFELLGVEAPAELG